MSKCINLKSTNQQQIKSTLMDHITTFTLPDGGPSFDMVRVPGGEFMMGSPEDEPERFPNETQHLVNVSDFHIGKFLVTQELWKAVFNEAPSRFKGDLLPVETVSWFDAVVFCNALSRLMGKQPCYVKDGNKVFGWNEQQEIWYLPNKGEVWCDFEVNGFRLPTEDQWEYAARGGPFALSQQVPPEKDYLYAGSDQLGQVGWVDGNSDGRTREVGLLLPNALGLYDMSGNVYEWCNDVMGYLGATSEPGPKSLEKEAYRVLRGGGWGGGRGRLPRYCRVAYRLSSEARHRYAHGGLRLVQHSVD